MATTFFIVVAPNVADHRPRASELPIGTVRSSRGSVHLLCSTIYSKVHQMEIPCSGRKQTKDHQTDSNQTPALYRHGGVGGRLPSIDLPLIARKPQQYRAPKHHKYNSENQWHNAEHLCSGRAGRGHSIAKRDGIPPLPGARSLGPSVLREILCSLKDVVCIGQ
jgi:hypothetical protein